MSANEATIEGAVQRTRETTQYGYLFSRGWDFLLLGGGSVVALVLLRLALHDEGREFSFATTLLLANFVNHPHFAHSYQMFYRDFSNKLTRYPRALRIRYLFSGLITPVFLAIFFAVTIATQSVRVLGVAADLMFLLVGWHYVKQGYGMAMVDAVLKRAFYTDQEKRCLLQNAYAVWILSWLMANYLGTQHRTYFDIAYFVLPVSSEMLMLVGLVCGVTTARVVYVMRKRILVGHAVAWNGLIAYGVSLYAWLLVRDAVVLLWIPLFHSLQYMTVVWRYEINRNFAKPSTIRPGLRFILFTTVGLGLGYMGFWVLPEWLNAHVDYPKAVFGPALFLYVFWIFINVHHYTMDAVMWRKGNPDVQAHLFTH